LVAGCLAVIILHHFLEAVFAGLRLFRVVSAMHFCQSMAFAAIALTLIMKWRADASSIVAGYAAACGLSVTGVLVWSMLRVRQVTDAAAAPRHREFWPVLLRFAVWVWVSNLLANVFSTVDRYMILHYGGFDSATALEMVGNYHASVIVPVLLVSVANLLTGAMIPHLSHAWEAGQTEDVSARVNLSLKLCSFGMLAVGCGLLLFCPLLFSAAFEGKYDAGLAVLPWTITACVWYSLMLIAQTYVWCAEKTRSATAPLIAGIASNVTLNLLLLPRFGLTGAVAATAAATLLAHLAQLVVNAKTGMRVHPGTVALSFAPLLLLLGTGPSLAFLVAIAWAACSRDGLLTSDERRTLLDRVERVTRRLGVPSDRGEPRSASQPN
ncbi:MAG: lipopolysaccharide biosynthesis protein, partial [Planctomycetota bacterium]